MIAHFFTRMYLLAAIKYALIAVITWCPTQVHLFAGLDNVAAWWRVPDNYAHGIGAWMLDTPASLDEFIRADLTKYEDDECVR